MLAGPLGGRQLATCIGPHMRDSLGRRDAIPGGVDEAEAAAKTEYRGTWHASLTCMDGVRADEAPMTPPPGSSGYGGDTTDNKEVLLAEAPRQVAEKAERREPVASSDLAEPGTHLAGPGLLCLVVVNSRLSFAGRCRLMFTFFVLDPGRHVDPVLLYLPADLFCVLAQPHSCALSSAVGSKVTCRCTRTAHRLPALCGRLH